MVKPVYPPTTSLLGGINMERLQRIEWMQSDDISSHEPLESVEIKMAIVTYKNVIHYTFF